MFSETDVFWKSPTVYDVGGLLGLLIGILSIWYAWYLARKQLRADFRKAADEAVDLVAQLVLGNDVADATRYLREVVRLLGEKEWVQTQMRLDDTATLIARFASNVKLPVTEKMEWTRRVILLRTLLVQVRDHARSAKNRGHLPPDQIAPVEPMIAELDLLRGRLMAGAHRTTLAEGTHGQ